MASYCYRLCIDGREDPVRPSPCDTAEAAIAHAGKMLLEAVAVARPALAYCVVSAGEAIGAEAVGCWDHRNDTPGPLWTPRLEASEKLMAG